MLTVFYYKRGDSPATISLLLLLAGDIHPNPGPQRYPCAVCKYDCTYQHHSVRCTKCRHWVHLHCSSLPNTHAYPQKWICPTCKNTPQPSPLLPNTLNILQLNAGGIKTKHGEISDFLHEHNIHIALIQETKLKPNTRLTTFTDYTTLRLDTQPSEHGLITLVHKNIQFTNTTQQLTTLITDQHTKIQSIKIQIKNKEFNIINLYIPPVSRTCPRDFLPDLSTLSNTPNLIMAGDFNAHHTSWLNTQNNDPRGTHIHDNLIHLIPLNNPTLPTRIPTQRNQNNTSPDITFCTPNLHTDLTWTPVTALSSDHLPIITSLKLQSPLCSKVKTTFINYRKADWTSYKNYIEDKLSNFNINTYPSVNHAANTITNIIQQASRNNIPHGYRKKYNPNYSQHTAELIQQRNALRLKPSLTPNDKETLSNLNTQITHNITQKQTEKWQQYISSLNNNTSSTILFKTIKNIHKSHLHPNPTHEALLTHNGKISSPKQHCNILMHHYSKISHKPTTQQNRCTLKNLRKIKLKNNPPPLNH